MFDFTGLKKIGKELKKEKAKKKKKKLKKKNKKNFLILNETPLLN